GFFALTSTIRSNCIVMNGSHGLKDRRALLAGIGGLAAGALMTNRTEAGPLNPPAAPNPTMKTLDQIEPRTAINSVNTPGDADSVFRITSPGSYYLTGNVTGVSGDRGIEVAANNVTIDLNGFALVGVSGALAGIGTVGTAVTGLVITNGTIQSWPGGGISAINASG